MAAVTKQQQQQQPHIIVVTIPAQGHLNPSLHFSQRLLLLGCRVTLVTTVSAHSHLIAANKTSLPDGLSIATFSDGYDDVFGSSRKSKHDPHKQWVHMNNRGAQFLNELIVTNAEEGTPVSCLVYTLLLTWIVDVARDNNLAAILFWIQPATVLDIYYYLANGYEEAFEKCKDPSFRGEELPSFAAPWNPYHLLREGMKEQVKVLTQESKVLVNTFDELEFEAINASDVKLEMIGVGPLVPSHCLIDSVNNNVEKDCTLTWLDTQAVSSVVYVSFGTMAVISRRQKEEMGKGLLSSNRPFLWVMRKEYEKEGNGEEAEEMMRWREEMETKAMSVGGKIVEWCSQGEVLSHEAVGCFVTHCGWNSTLEGMCLGVPLVAFPQWSDQMTNAKLVEDVWKIGVRVVVPEKLESEEAVVEGDEIRRCLDLVMGEGGQVGEQVRKNANKWKQLAKDAMREGGSSHSNLQAFVNEVTGK
ncbi:UDP-glycosyltransferase 75C1 [Linum grandiflorum]